MTAPGGAFLNLGPIQFLIVCPLVFLAGFVDAVAGGGGLISLPAYMIAGLPVHFAIATNKLSSGMGTAIATTQYARKGYIPWKQAVFCVVCALAGSNLGARLALLLSDDVFQLIMLIILPLTALYVTRSKTLAVEKEPVSTGVTLAVSMLAAFGIGIYDGFYGPGTGTFLILLLTSAAHMGLRNANGISKAINLTTNLTALAVYAMNGKVLFPLGLAAGLFSIAGNSLGARLFESRGARVVKPIMLTVLVIFFIRVVLERTGLLT